MERETIVAHVVTGARQVFETMLGMELHPGQDYIETSPQPASRGVVALIGLGGAWMGTGIVACSPELACKMASAMLLSEYQSVSEDVLDAMAEIANMIFGYMKTEIEEQLGGLCLSIPTVVFGRNFLTRSVGNQPWSVIPVKVGDETLELRICLTPNRETNNVGRTLAP
ncbi:MAG TPA: chemotaxis protein CheX [Bryobacteraceae bacterium]|nr:chemotaxis protein CheX [Bryobacteraceae bacterium]